MASGNIFSSLVYQDEVASDGLFHVSWRCRLGSRRGQARLRMDNFRPYWREVARIRRGLWPVSGTGPVRQVTQSPLLLPGMPTSDRHSFTRAPLGRIPLTHNT